MTYIPRNWFNGDRITAERLNHMEEGIASASQGGSGDSSDNGILIVNIEEENDTLVADKTYAEIVSALSSGKVPVVNFFGEYLYLQQAHEGNPYVFVGPTYVSAEFKSVGNDCVKINTDNTISEHYNELFIE